MYYEAPFVEHLNLKPTKNFFVSQRLDSHFSRYLLPTQRCAWAWLGTTG